MTKSIALLAAHMTKSKKDKLTSTKHNCLIENQKRIAEEIKLLTAQSPADIYKMMLLAESEIKPKRDESSVISSKTIERQKIKVDENNAQIRVRYFELPVKKSTFQADALKLVALFDKESEQLLIERVSKLTEDLIQKILIDMKNYLKMPLSSVHLTNQFLKPSTENWDIAGESVAVTYSQTPIKAIFIQKVLDEKKLEVRDFCEPFENAKERDDFYNTLTKTSKRYAKEHASELSKARKQITKNRTDKPAHPSSEIYNCPAEVLELVINSLQEINSYEIADYLKTLSFNTTVNRIDFADMNDLSKSVSTHFNQEASENFLCAVEYAHLKYTPMSKFFEHVEKSTTNTLEELGLEQFRSS
jgi:hypothetical protein